jgi:hypothetical protein
VLADWTGLMYRQHGAHHMDVLSGATVYRVFLLASTLQVDIAFAPEAEFGAIAPTFRLIFGTAVNRPQRRRPARLSSSALAGCETIQVYASRPDSAVERPVRWLAGSPKPKQRRGRGYGGRPGSASPSGPLGYRSRDLGRRTGRVSARHGRSSPDLRLSIAVTVSPVQGRPPSAGLAASGVPERRER